MATELIPLADAIAELRKQLAAARAQGEGEALRFEVGDVELELNLVVQREAGAGGSVGLKIFGWGTDVSAQGKLADERTHKLTIKLTPKLDGQVLDVADSLGAVRRRGADPGGEVAREGR